MPSPCGERIDITFVLKSIIDSYPAGGAVLRELLQNSDDAGARSQTFRLDTTSYSEDGLTDQALARCQGPSLVAINDSTFSPKDWDALTTVHDSSKTSDETKTGKYGIGFRSCYHLTENPQVYSDTSLLILDPHREFKAPYAGGVKLESSDRNNPAFNNLFQPFASLNPNFGSYKGSAIRLPLRTADQAQRSKIKSGAGAAVTVEMVREWFQAFIKTELHEVLLFLKHITSVTFEIVNGSDISTIAYTRLANTNLEEITSKRSGNRGRHIEASHYILDIKTNVDTETMGDKPSRWMIVQFVDNIDDVKQALSKNLTRDVIEVEKQMTKEKLLPHVALAFPLQIETDDDPPLRGRLFSLLPVPIFTGFPLHIHAVFALLASRQHLRNRHEEIAKESLERLLVEWNYALFNTIIPRAWSYLLQNIHYVVSTLNIYSAWPDSVSSDSKQGDSLYWAELPAHLLKEIAPCSVWPSIVGNERLVLKDALVANDFQEDNLISALVAFGIAIICPPSEVLGLISKDAQLRKYVLSAKTAFVALEARPHKFEQVDEALIDTISEYLAMAHDIKMFRALPLVRNVSNRFIKLGPTTPVTFLASEDEAQLFADQNPQMLALDRMRDQTKGLIAEQSASIQPLNHTKVLSYLQSFHPTSSPPLVATANTLQWLCLFWNWLSTWTRGNSHLIKNIREYVMIPTRSGMLRRVAKGVLDPEGIEQELLEILNLLAIPSLHPDMSAEAKTFLTKYNFVVSSDNLGFLLEEARYDPSIASELSQVHRRSLQNYLSRLPHRTPLKKSQMTTLQTLPLFPILPPGDRCDPDYPPPSLEVADSSCNFVDSTVVVIPILEGVAFVNGDECHDFIAALRLANETKNELDVLRLVLDRPHQWQNQPQSISERLLERLFSRVSDLSAQYKEKLAKLSFIDVGGRTRPPVEVIDPESPLARLYDASDKELPIMTPAFSAILPQLRQSGFLRTELSTLIIEERLRKMNPSRMQTLLEVIDHHYQHHDDLPYTFLPESFCFKAWIPSPRGFLCIKDCRDQQPSDIQLLYDLALFGVGFTVQADSLRKRLGWGLVTTDTLLLQMKKAVDVDETQDSNKAQRIFVVLRELANRYKNNPFDISTLQSQLENRRWVPMSDAEFELPQYCTIDAVDLGPHSVFKQLPPSLGRNEVIVSFMKRFGVHPKPTTKLLLSALQNLQDANVHSRQLEADVIKQAIGILTEIARREPLPEEQRKLVPIPTRSDGGSPTPLFLPADQVCFNDLSEHDSTRISSMAFAHPSISLELADKLKLPRRSDLEFEQLGSVVFDAFTDISDLQVCIRRTIAIFNNASSSPRGWIADAILGYAEHAGASRVSFICNEKSVEIRSGPSPALSSYFQAPSLVVHHSAACSNFEIESLKLIAQDGKPSTPGSVGQFAFAILSLFSLGDIVMLISGSDVVFFDPSKTNLPKESRIRGGARRTGLKMSLENCKSLYPDFFAAVEGVEGFDMSKTQFKGTILVVPLRTDTKAALSSRISQTPVTPSSLVEQMQGAFYTNTTSALFFTRIRSVRAFRRKTSRALYQVWSVDTVADEPKWVAGRSHHRLTLTSSVTGQDAQMSAWLIISSQAVPPPQYSGLSLPRAISAALAIELSLFEEETDLFSANKKLFRTLPLPIATNLNMHINAPWILSEDPGQRQLLLDSPDQRQPTMGSQFNNWLLYDIIPWLVLHTIALLNTEDLRAIHNLWPGLSNIPSDDLIAQGFYEKLPITKELLLQTPSGRRVSPHEAVFGFSNKPSVRNLLQKLEPDRFVVPSFDPTFLPSSDAVETDSPAHVHKILLENARQILNAEILDDVDVDELIWYLLKANPRLPLVGLPLLRLQTDTITRFSSYRHQPAFEYNAAAAELFGEEDMMIRNGSCRLGRALIEEIVKLGEVNVRVLDASGLRSLLASSEFSIRPCPLWIPQDLARARSWIAEFWRRLDQGRLGFGAEIRPENLDDLPLIPTVNGPFISLSSCRNRVVFWRQARNQTVTAQNILDVLIQLGALVFDNHAPLLTTTIARRYRIAQEVNVNSVLDCLGGLGPPSTLMDKIPLKLWNRLAAWIKSQDANVLQMHDVFRTLPIWETRHSESILLQGDLKTLGEVYMLPHQSDISTITRYMTEASAARLARESPVLRYLLPKTQILSAERLVQELRLPDSLTPEEVPTFKAFLQILQKLKVPVANLKFIPNGKLQLSDPSQIFHHQKVPLYTFAFQQQPEHFVHEEFQDMMVWFESMAINKEVTPDGLITALAAIDELIRSEHELDSTNAGIEVAYAYLNQRPKIFEPDSRLAAFKKIRGLRFVERQPMRSKVHELEYAAIPVPIIASLDQLVSEENYLVAWTQRGRFITDPTQGMKLVFPKIGSPTAAEVVAHLATLAKVAQTHPQIATRIIPDIKTTYQWLNEHRELARSALRTRKSERIFWNVDAESRDMTIWHSATSMWFNLEWDEPEASVYTVKGLLDPYPELLEIAGVRKHVYRSWSGPTPNGTTFFETAHLVASGLRTQDKWTDVELQTEKGDVIRAHRIILAASSPYFMHLLENGGTTVMLPTYSYLEIRSAIDYIYTGQFTSPHPPIMVPGDASRALSALINMFELANQWGLSGLKLGAEKSVVDLKLVGPSTVERLLRICENVEANHLLLHCKAIVGDEGFEEGA